MVRIYLAGLAKKGLWSVEDGAIVGQTTKEHPVDAKHVSRLAGWRSWATSF
jgi:hypothetical protein